MNNQYSAKSILEVLHARGISDIALGKQTGIHRVSLNRIRNGKESGKTSLPILNQLIIESSLTTNERVILNASNTNQSKAETLETTEKDTDNEPEQKEGLIKRLWHGYLESVAENERRARYEAQRLENARKLVERADKKERAKQSLNEIQQHMQPVPTGQTRKQNKLDDTFDRLAVSKKQPQMNTSVAHTGNGPVCAVCQLSIGIRTVHSVGYNGKGKEIHICPNCATIPKYAQWLYEHRTPITSK